MKRVYIFFLASLIIFSFVSCRKNPESSIVVGKNNDRMLEIASGNEKEKKSISEMLNVPERMIASVSDGKGNIIVYVDADIFIPDTDGIPVVKVRRRDFTQEEADRVIKYFIGDMAFNNRYKVGYTSEEEKLMYWIEQLSKETDPDERRSLQQNIEKFKSAGITVPDKPHEILPASKVFEPTEYGATQIEGYSKDENNYKYLRIFNNLAQNKNMLIYTCEQKGYADTGYEANYYTEANKDALEKLGLRAAEKIPLAMSQEDAKNKAKEVLRALNISDMDLYSCEEVWGGAYLEGGIAKQQEHHAYRLEFVRSVGGVLATYTTNNINRSSVSIDEITGEKLAESWPYERVMFIIDDTGIVEFLWESPYEVTGQDVKHTKLMPFKDIQSIFSKMILVTQAQYGGDVKLTLNIDEVRLGMMRIQDKNGSGNGLLVPVWDFFGTMTMDGQELPKERISYLTINAIDGSIIDRMKGY